MTPVGGTSRHYGGVGIGRPAGWTCPACGALQGGPLEAGCTVCRAGQPGVRVEPDPRDPVVQSHTADVVLRAFDRWVAEDPTSRDLPALRSLVLAAFEGGWQASEARSIPVGQQEVRRNLAVPPLPFPVEGKVARTLARCSRGWPTRYRRS